MKNRPINDIRIGSIKATIWPNQAGEATRHNVTFTRSYKDGDQWKNSDSFGRDDLPKLILAAQRAYESIFTLTGKSNAADTD